MHYGQNRFKSDLYEPDYLIVCEFGYLIFANQKMCFFVIHDTTLRLDILYFC